MKINIGPYPDDGESIRNIDIHIDEYDTWSMDNTLALIIAPMLKQLKETKHGAPYVEIEDVPEELRPPKDFDFVKNGHDVDDKFFDRWDWILDEMIWSFERKCDFNADEFNDELENRMKNGFKLFGKYYECLWD